MEQRAASPRYFVVSPVKDEAKYIRETLESVIEQTVRPDLWLIVDDNSSDGTTEIVKSYCEQFDWIKLHVNSRVGQRDTGSAEAVAFNAGYETVQDAEFDFIVKLDGDLRLEPQYFEKLFKEFERDKSLGIASGIYLENHGSVWKPVPMPRYHAAGATKVIRRRCFQEIGGFITTPGWDTVDEIRAWGKGWRTAHFQHIIFHHLKNEGSGMGYRKMNLMHGEIFYLTGGSKIFFLVKTVSRMILGRPFLLAGFYMLCGYIKPLLQSKSLLVSNEEAKHYQKMLLDRIRIFNLGRN